MRWDSSDKSDSRIVQASDWRKWDIYDTFEHRCARALRPPTRVGSAKAA